VLLERDLLAARDLGQSLVNVRLRPRQIVAPLKRKLGYALVDKLTRRRAVIASSPSLAGGVRRP